MNSAVNICLEMIDLVAPATAPAKDGYVQVRAWLPEGEWYEMHTGTLLKGGQIVERPFAIDEYPIYVKAGAVLPMYTSKVMNLNGNDEEVVITVFPGGNGASSLVSTRIMETIRIMRQNML